jgi:two-component system, chemotaxis family, chemotaxis protein CheY
MPKLKSELANINFFIVEDVKAIRQQMVSDLREIGCAGKIIEAESLSMARELHGQHPIDFVICDWNLPDGIGIDFLKEFRRDVKNKKIPFVICTTNYEVAQFLEAVQSGANDFIVKPWRKEELMTKLNNCWAFVHKA